MPDVITFLPEILVSVFLGGLAWAFRSWSRTIERTSDKILNKLESLTTAFNEHRLRIENRVTKVEAQVIALEKRIEIFQHMVQLHKVDKIEE